MNDDKAAEEIKIYLLILNFWQVKLMKIIKIEKRN